MENKLYSNLTCPNPTENIGKGFITKKFTQCKNITHLKKLMYSNYQDQVIKILDNFFKNMNYLPESS